MTVYNDILFDDTRYLQSQALADDELKRQMSHESPCGIEKENDGAQSDVRACETCTVLNRHTCSIMQ